MPAKGKEQAKKAKDKDSGGAAKPEKQKAAGRRRGYVIAIFVIILVFALAGGLVYGVNRASPASFSTFRSNFLGSQRVAIVVTAYNGTALSSAVGCATSLIEQVVGNAQVHRNATTIDFYVLNQTSCVYSPSGLGSEQSNYSYSTPGRCINATRSEPSIFINYSNTNSTVITPGALYVSGNAKFLLQCGIASEISST